MLRAERMLPALGSGTLGARRCLAVEEGWPQSGIAAEISAIVVELAFDSLDAPVERVTGVEVPMPYAANLEAAALPTVDDIVRVAKRMVVK